MGSSFLRFITVCYLVFKHYFEDGKWTTQYQFLVTTIPQLYLFTRYTSALNTCPRSWFSWHSWSPEFILTRSWFEQPWIRLEAGNFVLHTLPAWFWNPPNQTILSVCIPGRHSTTEPLRPGQSGVEVVLCSNPAHQLYKSSCFLWWTKIEELTCRIK